MDSRHSRIRKGRTHDEDLGSDSRNGSVPLGLRKQVGGIKVSSLEPTDEMHTDASLFSTFIKEDSGRGKLGMSSPDRQFQSHRHHHACPSNSL